MKRRFYNIGRILTLAFLSIAWAEENDSYFKMCGTWVHLNGKQTLSYNLTPGCTSIIISANESTLSVRGSITAVCSASKLQLLNIMQDKSPFCVIWKPLLDQLMVQVDGRNITLCSANGVQTSCCTDLSAGRQNISEQYGILNGSVRGDTITSSVMAEYEFKGHTINCKDEFCDEAVQATNGANMIEDAVMKSGVVGNLDLPCAQSIVVEMNEDSNKGQNVTVPVPKNVPAKKAPSVYLPSCLPTIVKKIKIKVACTYYKKSTLFQNSSNDILEDVVGITVENEIIRNLPEPVRIMLHHSEIQANQTRKCVSWDTRRDKDIKWREDGCTTVFISSTETECHCNHLTYFAVLVQLNPERTPRHLEALTFITAIGCAVSIISCIILFVTLCRQRRGIDHSNLVHRGLVVALFFLCVLFILTGTVANVGHERVCQFMGGLLHYMLLSVLCWMAVEVIHTFWMIYMVFSPPPPSWIWYIVGFGFPALPVIILASVGNVYGRRIIAPSNLTKPYHMCWMTYSRAAQISHFITNIGLLTVVVISGFVMLFLVMWKIRNRDEWRRNSVAFLSIWGLSCLFGTTWALTFLSFELTETVLFLFCIINSLQGFFLMLRFYGLERLRRNSNFGTDFSSTGSTRQHMLQPQERSYT